MTLTGYLRFPEAAGVLTPRGSRDKRLWFTRDHLAMARALGWGDGRAVLYRSRATPVPENGIPKPGPLDVHLKDDHLQYAITWFALAGAVLIAFGRLGEGAASGLKISVGSRREPGIARGLLFRTYSRGWS